MMLKFDPNEDDDDIPPAEKSGQHSTPNSTPVKNNQNSEGQSEELPKIILNISKSEVTKELTAHPIHPAERGNYPYTQTDTKVSY